MIDTIKLTLKGLYATTKVFYTTYKPYIIAGITSLVVLVYTYLKITNNNLKQEVAEEKDRNEVLEVEVDGKLLQADINRDAQETVKDIKDVEEEHIMANSTIII